MQEGRLREERANVDSEALLSIFPPIDWCGSRRQRRFRIDSIACFA
jgi:hypothetical protein